MRVPDNWRVFNTAETLAQQLTQEILALAEHAIATHGAFHFMTAGGSTPNRCYQLLSQADADWAHWHIYMGDERVLPSEDKARNSQALCKNWLAKVAIPQQNRHFMQVEKGAQAAAQAYACLLDKVEAFDLCLLGMGEDGHTASLFPNHANGQSVQPVCCEQACDNDGAHAPIIIENHSPKAPPQRVSLNYGAFSKCRLLIKLITGAAKQPAVAQWLNHQANFPIALVKGQQTKVYIDQAALGQSNY